MEIGKAFAAVIIVTEYKYRVINSQCIPKGCNDWNGWGFLWKNVQAIRRVICQVMLPVNSIFFLRIPTIFFKYGFMRPLFCFIFNTYMMERTCVFMMPTYGVMPSFTRPLPIHFTTVVLTANNLLTYIWTIMRCCSPTSVMTMVDLDLTMIQAGCIRCIVKQRLLLENKEGN